MSWGNGLAVPLLTMYLESLVEPQVLTRIMELLVEMVVVLFAAWTDHFYLNGSSNPGVMWSLKCHPPFSFHFLKTVPCHGRLPSRCGSY